jgi:retron-type reverse transcriptase
MALRFGDLRHLADLANALGCLVEDLERFSQAPDQKVFYTAIRIPKRGKRRRGEFRTVYKVRQQLKLLQKNIGDAITGSTTFDECVQGFVLKRSIVTNARMHLGQALLLHADIERFFENITTVQVEKAFGSLGCRPEVASTLARICTLNGQLPEGSPSSPAIANIVARFLDVDLKNLAATNGCVYSRYADDLTFSGTGVPDPVQIEALLNQHGFKLRDKQCRTQRKGRSQYVTGLSISDPTRPRLPRVVKQRLRQELYYAAKFGLEDHLKRSGRDTEPLREAARLGGWISFMASVEGPEATERFHKKWMAVRETFFAGEPEEEDYDYGGSE